MTVCIAALCDDGKSCVLAADRFGVLHSGSLVEFGWDDLLSKIIQVSDRAAFLFSGASDLAQKLVDAYTSIKDPISTASRLELAIGQVQKTERDILIERELGSKMSYEELVRTIGGCTSGPLYELWQSIKTPTSFLCLLIEAANSRYEVISAGSDGMAAKPIALDYGAIGSGSVYAKAGFAMTRYDRRCDLPTAMLRVYMAKKAAEIAPGVGRSTDIVCLTQDGYRKLSENALNDLEQLRCQKAALHLSESESIAIRQMVDSSQNDNCLSR